MSSFNRFATFFFAILLASKGVVQLSGFVSSQVDINKAVQVARSVPGVVSVKNALRLK
jgi:osmotically-inducible protein OsmY